MFLPPAHRRQCWLLEQKGKVGSIGPSSPASRTPVLPAAGSPASPRRKSPLPALGNRWVAFKTRSGCPGPTPEVLSQLVRWDRGTGICTYPRDSETHHSREPPSEAGGTWGRGVSWGPCTQGEVPAFPTTKATLGGAQCLLRALRSLWGWARAEEGHCSQATWLPGAPDVSLSGRAEIPVTSAAPPVCARISSGVGSGRLCVWFGIALGLSLRVSSLQPWDSGGMSPTRVEENHKRVRNKMMFLLKIVPIAPLCLPTFLFLNEIWVSAQFQKALPGKLQD